MFRFNLKSKLIETALAIRQHTCDELQTDDDDPAYRHAAIRLVVVDVAFFSANLQEASCLLELVCRPPD